MGDGALTDAITGAIQGGMSGYSGYLKNGACFVAGTTVATATGLVAIEKIKAGDLVWKAADTIANLDSRATRSGTYDEFLRWIGK